MATLIVGRVTGVGTVQRGNPNTPDKQWTEDVITVLNGRYTVEAKVGGGFEKFRGDRPGEGEMVALSVGVECYVKRDGKAAYKFVAFGRDGEVEKALAVAETPALASVV